MGTYVVPPLKDPGKIRTNEEKEGQSPWTISKKLRNASTYNTRGEHMDGHCSPFIAAKWGL